MLAFTEMLVPPAVKAGMKAPNPETMNGYEGWSSEDYPHFYCFCQLQLGRSMLSFDEHWHNAEVIAAIPDDKIRTMTLVDFIAAGLQFST